MSLHQLSVPEALAGSIAMLLLLVQLALFRSVVVIELITLYAVQSALVALICLAVGITRGAVDLVILAVIAFAFKAIVLPAYMRALARNISTRVELPARINVTLSLLMAAVLMGIAMITSAQLPLHTGEFLPKADLAATLAIVFVGFLFAILRPNALAQVIGFLTLENGLFFGTVTLAPGLPFVVGILLLIDVLAALRIFAVLVGVLVAQRSSASIETLQQLRG
ncbi:MAG: hypothetical protein ACLPYS_10580 [Vulcanimicrobiaceae bacterium]